MILPLSRITRRRRPTVARNSLLNGIFCMGFIPLGRLKLAYFVQSKFSQKTSLLNGSDPAAAAATARVVPRVCLIMYTRIAYQMYVVVRRQPMIHTKVKYSLCKAASPVRPDFITTTSGVWCQYCTCMIANYYGNITTKYEAPPM